MSVKALAQAIALGTNAVLSGIPTADQAVLLTVINTGGTGLTGAFEGIDDGVSPVPLPGYRSDTFISDTGTVSVADGATKSWIVPTWGCNQVRFRPVALATGNPTANLRSMPAVNLLPTSVANATSFAGGIAVTSGFITESATNAITAHSGGTQAAAVALVSEVNGVTVAAANADSVKLPVSVAGYTICVINTGAKSIQVYGNGADTVNGATATVGVAQMANSVCFYACAVAGSWFCEGAGTGFSAGLPTTLFSDNLTAHSGGTQGAALALPSAINRVGTVAAQADSVLLPPSAAGLAITVINNGVFPMQVFGAGTDTINAIATATGISHGVGQIATYFCTIAGNWIVQFSQPQQAGLVSLTGATDAVPAHVAHTYVVNKAGVDAMTLAAPTATTDDGLQITIYSNTANAHTLTATGLLLTGTASVNLATFAAQKGAGLTLEAYQGKWVVLSAVGITFS